MRDGDAPFPPKWGGFSRAIRGRVGYQCSGFYRALVRTGEIHDPEFIAPRNAKKAIEAG
jgi:hypothetical protein